jgi:hypothetical protein
MARLHSVSIAPQVLFPGVTVPVIATHLALDIEVGFRYRSQIYLSSVTVRPVHIVTQPVIGLGNAFKCRSYIPFVGTSVSECFAEVARSFG